MEVLQVVQCVACLSRSLGTSSIARFEKEISLQHQRVVDDISKSLADTLCAAEFGTREVAQGLLT